MYYGVKNKWTVKKSFIVSVVWLFLIVLTFGIWVLPSSDSETWKFRIVVLLIGGFTLLGLSIAVDRRIKNRKS